MVADVEPIALPLEDDSEDIEYMNDYVSRAVAAQRLGVTVSSVIRLEKLGMLKSVKGGDGVRRILVADVDLWLENGGVRKKRAYTRKKKTVKQEIQALRDEVAVLRRAVHTMRKLLNFEGRFAAEMSKVLRRR